MQEPIVINIGEPEHGWLPVRFKSDVLNLDMDASDVLNDPLEELYRGLKRLLEHKTAEITFWLEPHTYFFYFERTGAKDFRLTISEADDINEVEKEQLAVLTGSYKELIAPIRKALLDFCELEYNKEHWPFSLKKEDIAALPKGL